MTHPLLSAHELHDLITGPAVQDILLLDLRWDLQGLHPDQFEAGHIPGAALCPLTPAFNDPQGAEGRHPLPPAQTVREQVSAWGVGEDTLVVVYDDAPAVRPSVRAWWCLTWAGHERTRVLDGGLAAWQEAGLPLATGPGRALPLLDGGRASAEQDSVDTGADLRGRTVVSTEQVVDQVGGRGAPLALFDVRAPERFTGESEPIDPVAGHIPGAVNLPTATLFDQTGRFRPHSELAHALAPTLAADERGETVVAYCGSGVTATHLVLARHLLGLPTALYAPSWSGWVSDPTRPIAQGTTEVASTSSSGRPTIARN